MTKGTITIESGEYKAIFTIKIKEDCNITVDFTPELRKQSQSKEETFRDNMAVALMKYFRGEAI